MTATGVTRCGPGSGFGWSWAAAAQHGEHAACENGREPAHAVPAPWCLRVAGLARGWGRRVVLGWTVLVCGPRLRQVVVEDCWAHRGLLCCAVAGVCLPPGVARGLQRYPANGVEGWLKSCCRGQAAGLARAAAGRRGWPGCGVKLPAWVAMAPGLSTARCLCWLPAVVPMADDACMRQVGERWARGGWGA